MVRLRYNAGAYRVNLHLAGRYLELRIWSGRLHVMTMILHRNDIPDQKWELRRAINWALGTQCKLQQPMTDKQERYKNTLIEVIVNGIMTFTKTAGAEFARDAPTFSKYDKEYMIKKGVEVTGFSEYTPDTINPHWGRPRLRITPYRNADVFDERLFAPKPETLRLTVYLSKDGRYEYARDEFNNLIINIAGIEAVPETVETDKGPVPSGKVAGIKLNLDETITPDKAPRGTRALSRLDLVWNEEYPRAIEITYRVRKERKDLTPC